MFFSAIGRVVEYLIRHKNVKYALLFIILLGCINSLFNISRYAFPQVDFREVYISVLVEGRTAEEIESTVVLPIEDKLKAVEGIAEYTAEIIDNFMTIRVIIKDNAALEKVKKGIRAAISDNPNLSAEIQERVDIHEIKSENFPELSFGIVSRKGDLVQVREHARSLKKIIEGISGVLSVEGVNVPDKEIHVSLERSKLVAADLSLLEVNQAISEAIAETTQQEGESEIEILRGASESDIAEPLRNVVVKEIPIASSGKGEAFSNILVRDIGTVKEELATLSKEIHHYNGDRGVGLNIIKEPSADVIRVVDEIKLAIKAYEQYEIADEDIKTVTIFDGSQETRDRLSLVYENGLLGIGLVLLVLVLFLSRVVAFWTTIGIVTSIAITFVFLGFLDISINSLSLCGMIIALGIIVDGAIVVSENVYTFKERGYLTGEASVKGLQGVLKPLLTMQFTTMAAFASIFLLEGSVGDFAKEVPIVTISMLLASLIDAIIFLPAHLGSSHWIPRTKYVPVDEEIPVGEENIELRAEREEENSRKQFLALGKVKRVFLFARLRLINIFRFYYLILLKRIIKKPYITFAVLLGGFILIGWGSLRVSDFEMFPLEHADVLEIQGEIADGGTLLETSAVVEAIEDIMGELPASTVLSYHTVIGQQFENHFFTSLRLSQFGKREETVLDVRDFIFNRIEEEKLPLVSLWHYIDAGGPRYGQPVEVSIIGEGDNRRSILVEEIRQDMERLGLQEIRSDLKPFRATPRMVALTDATSLLGVPSEKIGTTLRTAFNGEIVGSVSEQEKRTNVRVKFSEEDVNENRPLSNVLVKNGQGRAYFLEELVGVEEVNALGAIYHRSGKPQNTVTARFNTTEITAGEVHTELKRKYQDFSKEHPGFVIKIGGEGEESIATFYAVIFSIMAATFFIYLFLVLQFNNFIQPLIAVSAIPLSIVGTMVAFYFHGVKFSVFGMLGLLGATGVVVNVSLVMVEFMNRIFAQHEERWKREGIKPEKHERLNLLGQSVLAGARGRFRPIFITTLTTLAGIIPTVYGFVNPADSFIFPMTLAMFWGIGIGTASSLITIPIFYFIEKNVLWHIRQMKLSNFFPKNKKRAGNNTRKINIG